MIGLRVTKFVVISLFAFNSGPHQGQVLLTTIERFLIFPYSDFFLRIKVILIDLIDIDFMEEQNSMDNNLNYEQI